VPLTSSGPRRSFGEARIDRVARQWMVSFLVIAEAATFELPEYFAVSV
jgi:hypothetical protein